jgi:hypothetical protein
MDASKHAYIYLDMTVAGMHWPGRGTTATSAQYARISGRWLSDTEFQTPGGAVLLVPPPGADGVREGLVTWRDSEAAN